MNSRRTYDPWLVTLLTGVTFFYFLIFAQFGYLHLLSELVHESNKVELALLIMGIGGILFSAITASMYNIRAAKIWVLAGFLCSGIAAVLAAFVTNITLHYLIALAVGGSLGCITVSIIPVIRALCPPGKIGRWVSLGVGMAYAICNLPQVFNAGSTRHCLYAALAACIGAVLALNLPDMLPEDLATSNAEETTPKGFYRKSGIVAVVLILSALVWFDSAAFYLIQETPAIKAASWTSSAQLLGNSVIHMVAAVLAGWLVDRGWIFYSLILSMLLLMVGHLQMNVLQYGFSAGNTAYLSGVSIYSTGLVCYAALAADNVGSMRIVQRGALVFAICGWLASAMGIGMVRDLHYLPTTFISIISVLTIACGYWAIFRLGRSGMEEIAE